MRTGPAATRAELTFRAMKQIEASRPDVWALAMLASPARRIEPELLRALRVELGDAFAESARPHAGSEAALWFSSLVESRGPDSITLLPEASGYLQQRLLERAEILEAARKVIESSHKRIAPVLQWEEELIYLGLTESLSGAERKRRIQSAAERAFNAISDESRPALEDRIREVRPRLPERAATNEYFANLERLCQARALQRMGEASDEAAQQLETTLLGLRKAGDILVIGPARGARVVIRVPALEPVTLEVLKSRRSRVPERTLAVRNEHTVEIPFRNRVLVLRTAGGDVYEITPDLFEDTALERDAFDVAVAREARVIVLGDGGAGKTSLVRVLLGDAFAGTESTTHGIEVHAWRVSQEGSAPINVHIWDFGGQEIYHGFEAPFLTSRSLYLVVVSSRHESGSATVERWLKRVEMYAGDSPVILVLTGADVSSLQIDLTAIRARFPSVLEFSRTSAVTGSGITELREQLARVVASMPNSAVSMPRSWHAVRGQLRELRELHIPFERYGAMCAKNGVADAEAQATLAATLHDQGEILHFVDDAYLSQRVILNPVWVAQGFARIVDSEVVQAKRGRFMAEELRGIPEHEILLRLLNRFELCFRSGQGEGRYVIPQMLPREEPVIGADFEPQSCLNFLYEYAELPETLLSQFIARTSRWSREGLQWRTGTVLEFGDNRVLVRGDEFARTVQIHVAGPVSQRRAALGRVGREFDGVHRAYRRLRVTALVPLPQHPSVSIAHDELLKFHAAGVKTVPKLVNGEVLNLDVEELLRSVDERDEQKPKPLTLPARVFLSYSHQDERLRQDLDTHLSLLRREGLVDVWSDRALQAGEAWAERIAEELQRADLFVLLVSPSYLASEFLTATELPQMLERHARGEATIVPVIARPCAWDLTPLRTLEALPRSGRPLTDHRDRDSAWRDVIEGIRRAIQARQAGATDYRELPPIEPPQRGRSVAVLYARQDQRDIERFATWMAPLRRAGWIQEWTVAELGGSQPFDEFRREIEEADVIILCVSSNFLVREELYGPEVSRALRRQEEGEARVLPVILRPCLWEDTPLGRLQVLPHAGKVLSSYRDRDKGWNEVVQGLRRVLEADASAPGWRSAQPFPVRTVRHARARTVCVYAHADQSLVEEFHRWLKLLARSGHIDQGEDRIIQFNESPGQDGGARETDADLVVLFLSADLLASDYIFGPIMKRVFERERCGETIIALVLVRPCAWTQTPLGKSVVLPRSGVAISEQDDRDEGWTTVAEELKALLGRGDENLAE